MSEQVLITPFTAVARREDQLNREVDITDVRVLPIIRVAFYIYIASIPFETVDLGRIELTSITFGILLFTLLFQFSICLKRPPLAYACFFIYTGVFAFPIVTGQTAFGEEATWQLKVILHLVVMSWVAFNLMKSERIARGAIIALAMSCALLAVLQVTGISKTTVGYGDSMQRTTSFGFHPNNLARILCLGLLALVGLTYGGMKKEPNFPRAFVWIMVALIGYAIVQTGSRGGLVALVAGLSFVVLRQGDLGDKIRNVAVLTVGVGLVGAIAYQSPLLRERFERALDDGDLARREEIYPAAWEMVEERPLTGWGGKDSEFELGTRLAREDEASKNPHNLFLYVLVATGAVGTIPMVLGLVLTARSAWRSRHGPRGVVPLSLLSTVVVVNMSGLWLFSKMHWFVVAYVLSATSVFVLRQKTERDEARSLSDTGKLRRTPRYA